MKTANGLQNAICKYLEWTGHYGNRINTMGRDIVVKKEASFGYFEERKRIKSSTRKGTSDLNCIINGKSVQLEVKVGRDKQSEDQIKEQKRVERAGGMYFLIRTMIEFYEVYDRLVSPELFR